MNRHKEARTADGRNRGLALGVTGGIGCGKSEVGRILQACGVEVLEADVVAHDVMRRGQEVYDAVVGHFGESILDDGGDVDRRKLGRIVFSDREAMEALNALVHPATRTKWRAWMEEATGEGKDAAVIIPLLFEVGEVGPWDAVICVTASEKNTRARLCERGLGDEDIAQRMAAQWPLSEKAARADFVIENDGTIEELETRTTNVLKELRKREGKHHG